jgi:hypothetical protein
LYVASHGGVTWVTELGLATGDTPEAARNAVTRIA